MKHSNFVSLFLRHERELAGFARAMLPTWDLVDDVLQEASLVMWRKLGQLEREDEFVPWAKVIVRFESLKHVRRLSRDRLVFDESLLALLADEGQREDRAMADREKQALSRCLERFSPDQRNLLLAPYRGRGRVKELAVRVGKTPNSLYKLLGRLRQDLHDCVQQCLCHVDLEGVEP